MIPPDLDALIASLPAALTDAPILGPVEHVSLTAVDFDALTATVRYRDAEHVLVIAIDRNSDGEGGPYFYDCAAGSEDALNQAALDYATGQALHDAWRVWLWKEVA